jgi:hypothetical protein
MIGVLAWEQCPDNGGRMRIRLHGCVLILAGPASAAENRGGTGFPGRFQRDILVAVGDSLIRGVTG